MKTFEVVTIELGTRTRKYHVEAENSEDAVDKVFEEGILPIREHFKQLELNEATVKERG